MIKAVIFDFDGVVVESADIKTNAFAKLFESENPRIINEIIAYHLRHAGVSRFDKFRHIYRNILRRGLDTKTFERLCLSFSKLVEDAVIKAPYVKGAKKFLDNYAGQYACFISTATPQSEIENIIKKRHMSGYFRKIYGAPKKKNDIVKEIVNESHISPHEAVYVGDALSDYEAAVNSRVNFIARIKGNGALFGGTNCPKIKDLDSLKELLNKELYGHGGQNARL